MYLTGTQRDVLGYFDAHDTGAMKFRGRWVSAKDICEDVALAGDFVREVVTDPYLDHYER
jgi:hypothetical protein